MRIHCLENVDKSLSFLVDQKVHLENVGAHDIVDGNNRLTLGLIWTIILRFQVQPLAPRSLHSARGLLVTPTCLAADSRHYHRRGGQQRNEVGERRAAALVSDEDGRLLERQRPQLHDELARRTRLQRAHSQTQVHHCTLYTQNNNNPTAVCALHSHFLCDAPRCACA